MAAAGLATGLLAAAALAGAAAVAGLGLLFTVGILTFNSAFSQDSLICEEVTNM